MIIKRQKYLDFLLKQKDKDIIKIITGIRRSGKSTLLFDIYYHELLKLGVAEQKIIRIALDNIKNVSLKNPIAFF